MNSKSPRAHLCAAFTLIEVVLAVAISLAMLGLILYFYQQAGHARQQVINEVEKISAARLLLEKITQDLRCARPDEVLKQGLKGESNSVQFLRTEFPGANAWRSSSESAFAAPESDLHWVRYSLSSDTNSPTGIVLSRLEVPYWGEGIRTNSEPAPNAGTNEITESASAPITDQLHFLQFRYWTGSSWASSWNDPVLPTGVEVSLGAEPLPDGIGADEYPFPVYRRVIFLPGSLIGALPRTALPETNQLRSESP